VPDAPVDVIAWRVTASGPRPTLALPGRQGGDRDPRSAREDKRLIYIPDANEYVDTPVYDRYRLHAGATLDGPAVIEERESTVVVNGAAQIRVDDDHNLIV